MNTKEIRRQNLIALLSRYETLPEFEDAAKVSGNYASQIANGFRDMGHQYARDIEAGLGLPEGWMDKMHYKVDRQQYHDMLNDLDEEQLLRFEKALELAGFSKDIKTIDQSTKRREDKPGKSA